MHNEYTIVHKRLVLRGTPRSYTAHDLLKGHQVCHIGKIFTLCGRKLGKKALLTDYI